MLLISNLKQALDGIAPEDPLTPYPSLEGISTEITPPPLDIFKAAEKPSIDEPPPRSLNDTAVDE